MKLLSYLPILSELRYFQVAMYFLGGIALGYIVSLFLKRRRRIRNLAIFCLLVYLACEFLLGFLVFKISIAQKISYYAFYAGAVMLGGFIGLLTAYIEITVRRWWKRKHPVTYRKGHRHRHHHHHHHHRHHHSHHEHSGHSEEKKPEEQPVEQPAEQPAEQPEVPQNEKDGSCDTTVQ